MSSLLDVEKARIIRAGQALGSSLGEIGSFLKTRTFDGANDDHVLAFLAGQREQLMDRVAELRKPISFVHAKMALLSILSWISGHDLPLQRGQDVVADAEGLLVEGGDRPETQAAAQQDRFRLEQHFRA